MVASCRNTKNFGESRLADTTGLFCLHQSLQSERRMNRGANCSVNGTGFLMSSHISECYFGWEFHSLVEDWEFSYRNAHNNIKSGYAKKAMFYDEQVTTLRQFWRQRMRWVAGNMQLRKRVSELFA